MKSYEFNATPENGTIRIPDKYRNMITSEVKVILLEQKPSIDNKIDAKNHCKSDLLLPPTTNTEGWIFSREEANER